jgi:hypothetical protein
VGTTAAAPGGFIGWISTYGSIIGFFVQIAFYIVMAGAVLWASITWAKFAKFMMSDEITEVVAETPVDEFVD